MQIIEIIVELLETGKMLFGKNTCDVTRSKESEAEALRKFVQAINQMVGYDRSEVIHAYFEGKMNQKNAILKLVIDEPREPMTASLASILKMEYQKKRTIRFISIQSKRGRKGIYNEQSCIQALHEASEHLGNWFSRADYVNFTKSNEGFPCAATIARHIGKNKSLSWVKILSSAGFERDTLKLAK